MTDTQKALDALDVFEEYWKLIGYDPMGNGRFRQAISTIRAALAHLDALEKEQEELRAAVRDLAIALDHYEIPTEALLTHAATIAGCKQGGDDK